MAFATGLVVAITAFLTMRDLPKHSSPRTTDIAISFGRIAILFAIVAEIPGLRVTFEELIVPYARLTRFTRIGHERRMAKWPLGRQSGRNKELKDEESSCAPGY